MNTALRFQSTSSLVRNFSQRGTRSGALATPNHLLFPSARYAPNFRAFHATPQTGLEERHGTTIVCVRKNGHVCMMGDGMVSQGSR
eukprot:CAMPEP_0172441474 /NCGR_PEP_ID=MMETSP1065-20121228/2029_1 /TAXON_ID=265537 /ORGANISM="Amphiprora paludosa, Strain CCMP125" /LENGTH=85 /DNA_ID=CAMNT_0013190871 /DNA_START=14 /DNA_END=268 /DNA_ORIENTATION=+